MIRPVVIVNPISSGVELAPAFNARGISCIAISVDAPDCIGFGSKIRTQDFVDVVSENDDILRYLSDVNPIAILPGDELGIPLAERLNAKLLPDQANCPHKQLHRRHKAYMQFALQDANVPHLKTLNTAKEQQVSEWLNQEALHDGPLIIKPPVSAGSDKVFHIQPGEDWRIAFNTILNEPSKVTGKKNQTVVIQEQAQGIEYAIGTVSHNGKHHLAHLIQYNKTQYNGRSTVFDYVEFIPYSEQEHSTLLDYTYEALDALGIRWGAAHTEIMLTPKGPRLIETGARMCGGPVVQFARQATGSSQVDKWVEIILDGKPSCASYQLKNPVVPVFLKSPAHGRVSNAQVFDGIDALSTLFSKNLWFNNGDEVPQTVDYLSNIGIVALSGDRQQIAHDYQKIRQMESQLAIV